MKKIVYLLLFCFLTANLYGQADWSQDTVLVDMIDGSWDPRAVCCGDTIHLVWHQRYAHDETYYKRSTDCGFTWSDHVMLSIEDDIESTCPDVAAKGDTVIVVWNEYNQAMVVYRISEDGGETFGLADSITGPGMGFPSIAMIEDSVYMCMQSYAAGGNPGVYYTSSSDGGRTWGPLRRIYTDTISQQPRISVALPDVHIVFSADDTSYAGTEIFCLSSHDGGRTWEVPAIISHRDSIPSQMPSNTSWSGGTATTWYDYKYSPYMWTGDIFFRRNVDSLTNNWDEIDSLTTAHRAVQSDILAERTHLHVMWEDERNDPSNNFEIYYRESTDYGETWQPEVRLTDAPWYSICPSLACGGGYLHLFWQDRRDYGNPGNAPLYYKRKDLTPGIVEKNQKQMQIFLSVFPNPSKNNVTISFVSTKPSTFIEIFDVVGRRVFSKPTVVRGYNEVIWDGKDQQGKEVRTGIYFIQLKAEDQTITEKVIVVK
ncbi:hypothetical protein AMJ74_00020 [candidate division WOR_3 bacterium SM1_77]|uniref:Secretion system C-terminal sorting domain-containing protein n=1 Tax=candidate division WOR_3 bacterium SM1_77 TaxID=1703778 RepID=A0A0S8K4M6_UNCW3|nr:MAG: hypothetical protein AMJ74_00020 [candidate division WOR_3 bacterium SM1_77]